MLDFFFLLVLFKSPKYYHSFLPGSQSVSRYETCLHCGQEAVAEVGLRCLLNAFAETSAGQAQCSW